MPREAGRMPVLQGGAPCFTGDGKPRTDAGQRCHLWVFRGRKFSLQFALLLKAHLASEGNQSNSTELHHLARYPNIPIPTGTAVPVQDAGARAGMSWGWDNFGGEGLGGVWAEGQCI